MPAQPPDFPVVFWRAQTQEVDKCPVQAGLHGGGEGGEDSSQLLGAQSQALRGG